MTSRGGQWACAVCTLENRARQRKCSACDSPRPAERAAAATPAVPSTTCGASRVRSSSIVAEVPELAEATDARHTKKQKTGNDANDKIPTPQKPERSSTSCKSRRRSQTSQKAPVVSKWLRRQKRKRGQSTTTGEATPPHSFSGTGMVDDNETLEQPLFATMHGPSGSGPCSSASTEIISIGDSDQSQQATMPSPATALPRDASSAPLTSPGPQTEVEPQQDQVTPPPNDHNQHASILLEGTNSAPIITTSSREDTAFRQEPFAAKPSDGNRHETGEGSETGKSQTTEIMTKPEKHHPAQFGIVAAATSPASAGSGVGTKSDPKGVSPTPDEAITAAMSSPSKPMSFNARSSTSIHFELESAHQIQEHGKISDVCRSRHEQLVPLTTAAAATSLCVLDAADACKTQSWTLADESDKSRQLPTSPTVASSSHDGEHFSFEECANSSNNVDNPQRSVLEGYAALEESPRIESTVEETKLITNRTEEESRALRGVLCNSHGEVSSNHKAVNWTERELDSGQPTNNNRIECAFNESIINNLQKSLLQCEGIDSVHLHQNGNREVPGRHENQTAAAMRNPGLEEHESDGNYDDFGFMYTPPSQMSQDYQYPVSATAVNDLFDDTASPPHAASATMAVQIQISTSIPEKLPVQRLARMPHSPSDEHPQGQYSSPQSTPPPTLVGDDRFQGVNGNSKRYVTAPGSKLIHVPTTTTFPTTRPARPEKSAQSSARNGADVPLHKTASAALSGDEKKLLLSHSVSASCKAPPGFHTAGRATKIEASEESMRKAEQLLLGKHDTNTTNVLIDSDASIPRAPTAVGFSAAATGSKVVAPEESMERADPLLEGQADLSGYYGANHSAANSVQAPAALGFSTAGEDTNVVASEKSTNAKQILVREFNPAYSHARTHSAIKSAKTPPTVAFLTAGRSCKVVASQKNMKKAEHLFVEQSEPSPYNSSAAFSQATPAFQSAGRGTKVVALWESLKKAEQVCQCDLTLATAPHQSTVAFARAPRALQADGGGTKIVALGESLKKAEHILVAESDSNVASVPIKSAVGSDQTHSEFFQTSGISAQATSAFQTAGQGTKVVASGESLKKAEQILLGQTDPTAATTPSHSATHGSAQSPPAFQTARQGADVVASDNSLMSENIMAEQSDLSAASAPNHSTTRSSVKAPQASAFCTAGSDTEVVASDEGMKAAEQLWLGESSTTCSHTFGFHTPGRNSGDKPSSDALVRAESVLSNPLTDAVAHTFPMAARGTKLATLPESQHTGELQLQRVGSGQSNILGRSGYSSKHEHSAKLEPVERTSRETEVLIECTSAAHSIMMSDGKLQGEVPTSLERQCNTYAQPLNATPVAVIGNNQRDTPACGRVLLETSLVTMSAGWRKRYDGEDIYSTDLKGLSLRERLEMVTSKLFEPCNNDLVAYVQNLAKAGKMTANRGQCLRDGVLEVTIQVDSTNAGKLNFSQNGHPNSFSGDCVPPCGLIGFCNDLRLSLIGLGCKGGSISDAWICNHKRWIVWKLASTERKFSVVFGGLLLTYDNLVTMLYRRYNKEIKEGKRSAIRKILNKDLSPSFMMILCVCNIFSYERDTQNPATKNSASGELSTTGRRVEFSMELSDDWYSVHAVADDRVCDAIREGNIRIGTKLMIANATLVGSDEGIDPLDSSYTPEQKNCATFLRFTANASRIAKWDAKLGVIAPKRQVPCEAGLFRVRKVSDIVPGGGFIPLIYLTVCRIYPLMYRIRKASGHDEWLSVSDENKQRLEFDKRKQKLMEAFIDEVEGECIKEVDGNAPDAFKRFEKSGMDPDSLTREDQREIEAWQSKRNALLGTLIQQEVEARMEEDPSLDRDSTPVVRVLVKSFDCHPGRLGIISGIRQEEAMLSLWQPTEEQMSFLREGAVLQLKDVAVRNQKREGRVQLSANPRSKIGFLPDALKQQNLARSGYSERKFTPFFRLHVTSRKMHTTSNVGECDVLGVVLKLVEQTGPGHRKKLVYLTDSSGLVIRVHCRPTDVADDFLRFGGSQAEQATIVAFLDLDILPFDAEENCGVVQFQDRSAARVPRRSKRVEDLRRWAGSKAGQTELRRVAAYLDAGLYTMQRPQSDFASAVGYIRGCSPATSKQFRILVDCGMPRFLELELPFNLVKDVKSAVNSSGPFSSTTIANHEAACSKHALLGKDFRIRGTLYKFMLKRKAQVFNGANHCEYEVSRVQPADVEAIAGAFSCSNIY